jgi:hypothetical protein
MQLIRTLATGACLLAGVVLAGAADDQPPPAGEKRFNLDQFIKRFDKNKDGFLDRSECPEPLQRVFDRLDLNKDGKLSRAELERVQDKLAQLMNPNNRGKNRPGGRPGEVITPAAKGERKTDQLKAGDPAPDFTLPTADGTGAVTLSGFRGRRPVVLVFASYT